MTSARSLLVAILLVLSAFPSFSQEREPEDSLVRLIQADTLRQVERNGRTYRRAVGNAVFLHNNTYLLCDTALWNVDSRIIEALGNVRIIQDRTRLESERMIYRIDRDLAEFRGNVVQLMDKDKNTLRTRHLDYNTKDSVAVFMKGGSMRDKDGQIIESTLGTYDSKIKVFTFTDDVNMFTDSIFVKTTWLKYESDRSLAIFGRGTDAWKDDNMLSADAGWYDRGREVFFFRDNVHVMSDTQEGWSDSLYFYRNTMNVDMLGNAQVTDTTRSVSGVAGHINYVDSDSRVTMTRRPAVIAEIQESGSVDTVYFGADTLVYTVKRMCDIDSLVIAAAAARKSGINVDPVTEFRRKAAAEAAQRAAEEAANDPNRPPEKPRQQQSSAEASSGKSASASSEQPSGKSVEPSPQVAAGVGDSRLSTAADSLTIPAAADSLTIPSASDSLTVPSASDSSAVVSADSSASYVPAPTDSLAASAGKAPADSIGVSTGIDSASDSLAVAGSVSDSLAVADSAVAVVPPDTTEIGFVTALRNVKIYRKTMQIICDSLEYSDLDSLARLYKSPVIWNEVTQQYMADSVFAVIRNQSMEKVSLMSNAFIHMQQDTSHYNQVKSVEMMAYFSPEGELTRFDALGGASALFYLEENNTLATANRKESKMLSAYFTDGNIHRVYYFDTAASDAYPVAQMTREDQRLKGFSWMPDKRPVDRFAVTPLRLRKPARKTYTAIPRAAFIQTDLYFPGYIDDIYVQIAVRDSLEKVRERERAIQEREQERLEEIRLKDSLFRADSLMKAAADSVALADSLRAVADSLHVADSLAAADSARVAAERLDSLSSPDRKQLREQAKAARAQKRAERAERKEERWAELDRRDAEKEAAKREKKLMKERRRKLKLLQAAEEEARRDAAEIERYKKKFAARQARKDARMAKKMKTD